MRQTVRESEIEGRVTLGEWGGQIERGQSRESGEEVRLTVRETEQSRVTLGEWGGRVREEIERGQSDIGRQ